MKWSWEIKKLSDFEHSFNSLFNSLYIASLFTLIDTCELALLCCSGSNEIVGGGRRGRYGIL